MYTAIIYAIALAVLSVMLLIYRIGAILLKQIQCLYLSSFRKHVSYPLLLTRRNGSSDVTRLDASMFVAFLTGNLVFMVVNVASLEEASRRASILSIINMVPLALSGRTNIFVDKVLALQLGRYEFAHRWVGRLCLAQGVFHGIVAMTLRRSNPRRIGIPLLVLAVLIGPLGHLYVRRKMFECFLFLHRSLVLSLLVLLWIHIGIQRNLPFICVAAASALCLLQYMVWGIFMVYHNYGQESNHACIQSVSSQSPGTQGVQLWIDMKRPRTVLPGQYFYVTVPHQAGQSFGILQAHPLMVAWVKNTTWYRTKTIAMLVETKHGFSNAIRYGHAGAIKIILDGPYGHSPNLESFDKVMFVASGIGIASHLLCIRNLILAHQEQSARVRRMSLCWLLDDRDQEKWAQPFIDELLQIDKQNVLNMIFYGPYDVVREGTRPARLGCELDLKWTIEKEWGAEAGNMAVMVCGNPRFERKVKEVICTSSRKIVMYKTAFQPDGPSKQQHLESQLKETGNKDNSLMPQAIHV